MSEISLAVSDSIVLEGTWSLQHASHLQKLLADRLAQLLEPEPAGPGRIQVDLTQVCELDACGCQLLVVFLENLKRHGIAPVPCGLKQQIMDTIDLLGFSDAFAAPL